MMKSKIKPEREIARNEPTPDELERLPSVVRQCRQEELQRRERERAIPRNEPMADEWERLPSKLDQWFRQELQQDDPKPSVSDCHELAQKIGRIVHRHENGELQKRYWKEELGDIPIEKLKAATIGDIEDKKRFKIANCATDIYESMKELEGLLNEVEKFFGPNYTFNNLSILELRDQIFNFKPSLAALGCHNEEAPKRSRGDHEAPWHTPAKQIAESIRDLLVKLGYEGNKCLSDEGSISIIIGTKIVNYVFKTKTKKIKEAAFVSAMRKRNRKRRLSKIE